MGLVAFWLLTGLSLADTGDTAVVQADADGDGYDAVDDCDDNDATSYPGAPERCDDDADNDCNGFFNDGCDDELQRGTLQGGQSCSTVGAVGGFWLPMVLLWGRRRR